MPQREAALAKEHLVFTSLDGKELIEIALGIYKYECVLDGRMGLSYGIWVSVSMKVVLLPGVGAYVLSL